MHVERNISTIDTPTAPLAEPAVVPVAVNDGLHVVETPVVYDTAYPAAHVAARTTVRSTIVPAAIIAGIMAVAMLVFGGIALARAGTDGPWRDPVVEVAGFTATATLGVIVGLAGLVLLVAALTRSREAILLMGILIGVASLVAVFEPTVGGGALAIERGFAVLLAIGSLITIVAATLVPTIRRTASHVERI